MGVPSVRIDTPSDGSVLNTHTVNVTGIATGSDGRWFQGAKADFEQGTLDSLLVNGSGSTVLPRRLADDFDDNVLNLTKWDRTVVGGMSAVERDNVLHLGGTVENVGATYREYARLEARAKVSTMISARLESFTGSGAGYRTHIFFIQDVSNYVQIGRIYDSATYGREVIEWGYTSSGSGNSGSLGDAPSGSHEYMITYIGGKVKVYQDGVQLASTTISLTNPEVYMVAAGKTKGDTVDAVWDDVISDYATPGTLVSSVHDTRSSPPTLTRVDWNGTAPASTAVGLEVRSSDSVDMASPAAWTSVTNGQASGLPVAMRYLQYRATLASTDGLATPSLANVTIAYHKPVVKVELSIDGMQTWTAASGKASWFAPLTLPENSTTIWVRATDVAGETDLRSITVDVDTVPPEGSVIIDDGEPFATSQAVTLTLSAHDHYGVSKMKVGSSPELGDADWQDYFLRLDWMLLPGDGPKAVYARFMDRNGLISGIVNDTIVLDTLPPVGSIAIDGGTRYTNRSTVTLALHADDVSGVVEMLLSESPSFEGAEWAPYQESTGYALSAGDGQKTIYARFKDQAGHVSAPISASIILDTVSPIMTIKIDGGAAYTRSRVLTVDLTVEHDGPIGQMQVGYDPAFVGVLPEPFAALKSMLAPEGDGPRTVYARAWDDAGNVGRTVSASITVDTVPPTVNLTINGGASFTNSVLVSLGFVVADDTLAVTLDVDDEPSLPHSTTQSVVSVLSWTLPSGDGRKDVYARVIDVAGNVGATVSASIILDTTPPALIVTIVGGAKYTRSTEVALRLDASDPSGIVEMQLSASADFSGVTPVPFAGTKVWNLSAGDGEKTVHARVRDGAGNWGPTANAAIALDTTPPTVLLSAERPREGKEEIKLSWQGSDALSGIATFDIQVRDGTGEWTNWMKGTNLTSTAFPGRFGHTYSFRARATDRVGNVGTFPDGPDGVAEVAVATPPRFLEGTSSYLLAMLIVAIVVASAAGYYLWRRRGKA